MDSLERRYAQWVEDFGDRGKQRIGWAKTIQSVPCNALITLAPNRAGKSLEYMEKMLRDWLFLADTRACKIRSNRIKTREQAMQMRIYGMFVTEISDLKDSAATSQASKQEPHLADFKTLHAQIPWMREQCSQLGIKFTDRAHIHLSGDTRGT